MLLLADRGFFCTRCGARRRRPAPTCCGGSARPAGRSRSPRRPAGRVLAGRPRRSTGAAERAKPSMTVRVIDYRIDDGRIIPQLPAVHHDPRPRRGTGGRAGLGLRPALGDRARLRRTEDPPTRTPHGAALEVPRPGAAGDLGTPVLPLRDPLPDGRAAVHAGTTPTGSASSPPYGSPGPPSPTRAIFPPDDPRQWMSFLRRLIARPYPPDEPSLTASDQTQDAEMAGQTRPPCALAPTRRSPHLPNPATLT